MNKDSRGTVTWILWIVIDHKSSDFLLAICSVSTQVRWVVYFYTMIFHFFAARARLNFLCIYKVFVSNIFICFLIICVLCVSRKQHLNRDMLHGSQKKPAMGQNNSIGSQTQQWDKTTPSGGKQTQQWGNTTPSGGEQTQQWDNTTPLGGKQTQQWDETTPLGGKQTQQWDDTTLSGIKQTQQ